LKKKLLALATVLALVAVVVVPMAVLASPVSTVYVSNLQPNATYSTANGMGGVYSAYYGPNNGYAAVSPGSTAFFDGKQAGIIYAGVTKDITDSVYEDQGLFAFKPGDTPIATFAGQALTYVVANQSGVDPVWMTIELNKGVAGDVTYQFLPAPYATGSWQTISAAAGSWQKWNNDQGDTTGNPLISLSQVATDNVGKTVSRVYLELGMGDSYNNGSGDGMANATVGWVNKVNIGPTEYDFVVAENGGSGTVSVTGDVIAATVAIAYTGSPSISFGTFHEGRNPLSGWTDTGADYGTVTVTSNSDASPSWSVNAFTINDAYANNYGKMVSAGLVRYLDDALYVSLDGGATYAQLPNTETITGSSLSANFRLSAAQNISHADVVAGQTTYTITVQLSAGVTP